MEVIYIDGTFDLLHTGHINLLKRYKKDNNYLIVGVISDENVKTYKRSPIISLVNRVKMLKAIKYVDKVISDCPFNGIPYSFIEKYKITKVIYAGKINTWSDHYEIPISLGIMEYIEYSKNELSTTSIIKKIKNDDHLLPNLHMTCNDTSTKFL